jgi:hypothetical protein
MIGATMFGAFILYLVTQRLSLFVQQLLIS